MREIVKVERDGGDPGAASTNSGHEAMLEKMTRRQEERVAKLESREMTTATAERRSFQSEFWSREAALGRQVAVARVPEQLEEVGRQVALLEKFIADSTAFMTAHEIRKAQEAAGELKLAARAQMEKVQPKKKFAFKSREKPLSDTANITKDVKVEIPGRTAKDLKQLILKNETIFENICNKTVSWSEVGGRDVVVKGLRGATLKLETFAATVHISDCADSIILAGPVTSSVFVADCSGCSFVLAAQQVRVHNTTASDFYCHVTGKAIIEDSRELRFAPYQFHYAGAEEDFSAAGLNMTTNNWDHVDDFNWLTSNALSPNWSCMAEKDRVLW